MWPNAKIGVMGGQQAQDVLNSIKSKGTDQNNDLVTQFEQESSAYYSTSRLWDDGIIDPMDTRSVVGLAIAIASNKKTPLPKNGIYRM
jgi:3-methylcrotonyl-CoA carboxylase beta subunit